MRVERVVMQLNQEAPNANSSMIFDFSIGGMGIMGSGRMSGPVDYDDEYYWRMPRTNGVSHRQRHHLLQL